MGAEGQTSCDSPAAPQEPVIGVFDSGVGGLSVVRALLGRAPQATVVYIADSAHAPYGPRPVEWIRERSSTLVDHLTGHGCQAVVVACNTATAAAAEHLRAQWALPIIGMEPAVKPAAAATHSGVVAVFATDGTLTSRRFAALLERYATGTRVVVEPCGDLVQFAEAGDWEGPAVTEAARRHLQNVIQAGADTIVLGCTHFPLLAGLLSRLAGGRVTLIDTSDAVARQVVSQLALPARGGDAARGSLTLLSSGPPEHLGDIAGRLLGAARARAPAASLEASRPAPQPFLSRK